MSFKKIDKEFCITDNSVNSYGFRLLTEGFQRDRFNPPIGYLMHNREGGVAVKWEDFRLEGDKLWARPVVNTLKYPSLADEIEAGFYNAASVGHIIALEWTDDQAMKLAGQTGITVTKWFCRECSIVDIPGNYNALAEVYDKDENSLANLVSQPGAKESIPAQFHGKTYAELWISGDLPKLTKTHPGYVQKLKEEHEKKYGIRGNKQVTGIGQAKTIMAYVDASDLQAPAQGGEIPAQYVGKSFSDLWMSGDLEHLQKTHPLYVQLLQENDRQEREKVRNRGTQVSDGKLAKAIDTALNPNV